MSSLPYQSRQSEGASSVLDVPALAAVTGPAPAPVPGPPPPRDPADAPGAAFGVPPGAPPGGGQAVRDERERPGGPAASGHMIVCGDDVLAHRLASELSDVYREQVTLVVPVATPSPQQPDAPRPGRAMALFGRVTAAVTRTTAAHTGAVGSPVGGAPAAADEGWTAIRIIEATAIDEDTLLRAGVERAAALALVHEDDETNIRHALAARRLSPRLRLVIRLYNRKLGQHLENLLDQAAAVAEPGLDPGVLDAATTVLSDADTAAPALAATAVAGTSKVVQAGGLLLRAVDRPPPGRGEIADPGLCTLALLSATTNDPAGIEGSHASGDLGPQLLPDDRAVAAATGRGTVALEAISHAGPNGNGAAARTGIAGFLPVASFFSRRLRWSLAGVVAAVAGIAVATWLTTGDHPLHAAYLTLLDIFAIGDPALGEQTSRQVLQILAGFTGLLVLLIIVAGLLEALGTFRSATSLRRPSRTLSGHVVLLGLGKVGTRVLARLRNLDIPVVCVESDPEARGIALARRLRVPTVVGDVTEEGVLEAARIHRAHALLALTSVDITNLEAALAGRALKPDLRVALRLYDDDFATAVYRTLRAAHPEALTRSRSVSHLSAPAFAGAMMGRQILGAIPVERRVLLFAALDVAGHPLLEGRTVAEAFVPGTWRVIALETTTPPQGAGRGARQNGRGDEQSDGRAQPHLVWQLHPGYVLNPGDRVVVATTRRGLAELL